MHRLLALFVIILIFNACHQTPDQQLKAISTAFQKEKNRLMSPGSSETESVVFIAEKSKLEKIDAFYEAYITKFQQIDFKGLQLENKEKFNQFKKDLNNLNVIRQGFYNDPSVYCILPVLKSILENNKLKQEIKVEKLNSLFEKTNNYYQLAVQNLKDVPSEEYEKAISNNSQAVILMKRNLADSINNWGLQLKENQNLMEQSQNSVLTIKNYIAWCESKRVELFTQQKTMVN